MKICNWGDLDRRLHVWEIVKINDGEKELNNKATKMYEVLTILSALCCAALIELQWPNSSHWIYLIHFYEPIRSFGIISSIFSIVISVTICSLLSATSTKNTFEFIKISIGFSNIPFFGTIISLICLILCASMQLWDVYAMIAFFPYSLFVIGYSFHFYGTLHQHIYKLTDKDTKEAIKNGYVFSTMKNDVENPVENEEIQLIEEVLENL
tara:strand:- start:3665 stop:4294 length:630 start_codon:yes stop_codon:yes gene_type:complete